MTAMYLGENLIKIFIKSLERNGVVMSWNTWNKREVWGREYQE
jgi:hypothetical protein